MRRMLALSVLALAVYVALAALGDPGASVVPYLAAHGVLLALMLAAWRAARADRRVLRVALVSALLFRFVAALGEPMLSDDVYRYVWDGRVQAHGIHPYRYAPADPRLRSLADDTTARVNHPELRTIYPPVAEMAFAALGVLGLGARGFRLAFGLVDFAVALALLGLLARRALPRERVLLYAWNPLAILESAGSGHVEPLGVLFVVLAVAALASSRSGWSAAALGTAIQAKLVPVLLVPGFGRRSRGRDALVLVVVLVGLAAPYAATGPAAGPGLVDYAERWEFNSLGFSLVRDTLAALDTGRLLVPVVSALGWQAGYRLVWPEPLARGIVGCLLVAWIAVVLRRRIVDPGREALWILGGALFLAPTVHPWYALWVLPFAALEGSTPWLVFAALVPLAYTGRGGEVSWLVRAVEYAPVVALALAERARDGSMARDRGP